MRTWVASWLMAGVRMVTNAQSVGQAFVAAGGRVGWPERGRRCSQQG
ncbi:hypothetical protein [Streptomyces griseoluteus]